MCCYQGVKMVRLLLATLIQEWYYIWSVNTRELLSLTSLLLRYHFRYIVIIITWHHHIIVAQAPNMDGQELWLVASGDRRVSVWSSDWSRTSCQLIDWLTFPGPPCAPDGTILHKGRKVNVLVLWTIIDQNISTVLIVVATCSRMNFIPNWHIVNCLVVVNMSLWWL